MRGSLLAVCSLIVLFMPLSWFGFFCILGFLLATISAIKHGIEQSLAVELEDLCHMGPSGCGQHTNEECPLSFPERIDGAVFMTGATGFVGLGVLHRLLASAGDLGVSRIYCLIRTKKGEGVDARLVKLRNNVAIRGLEEIFDRLVVGVEGDIGHRNFGWQADISNWPHREPLKVGLHCAASVSFDQSLQGAAVSIISATLQVVQVLARWGVPRCVVVSTAFVHPKPLAEPLPEEVFDFGIYDPVELYNDAMNDGSWATRVMNFFDFSNTYVFAKAIMEHLVLNMSKNCGIQTCIVRPSIVSVAWDSPFLGWGGDSPSTLTAVGALCYHGVFVWRFDDRSLPAIPVDVCAIMIVRALATCSGNSSDIFNIAVSPGEARLIPHTVHMLSVWWKKLAFDGAVSPVTAWLGIKLLTWPRSETAFRVVQFTVNKIPLATLITVLHCIEKIPRGITHEYWRKKVRLAMRLWNTTSLPQKYEPFTCPEKQWLFKSSVQMPADFDTTAYMHGINKATKGLLSLGSAHTDVEVLLNGELEFSFKGTQGLLHHSKAQQNVAVREIEQASAQGVEIAACRPVPEAVATARTDDGATSEAQGDIKEASAHEIETAACLTVPEIVAHGSDDGTTVESQAEGSAQGTETAECLTVPEIVAASSDDGTTCESQAEGSAQGTQTAECRRPAPAILVAARKDDGKTFESQAEAIKAVKACSQGEQLQLYGLYKQATVGNVNIERPGMFNVAGKAKWNAWNANKGKPQEEAKAAYVELVDTLTAKYGLG